MCYKLVYTKLIAIVLFIYLFNITSFSVQSVQKLISAE